MITKRKIAHLGLGFALAMISPATTMAIATTGGRSRFVISLEVHSSFNPLTLDVGRKKRD